MRVDEPTPHDAGESRQAFSVIASIDWGDGLSTASDGKVLLIVPRRMHPSAVAGRGGNALLGGDPM